MGIDQIIKLATEASKGKDSFKEEAVGSHGYGFVFKDYNLHSKEPYIVTYGNYKLCGVGAYRNQIKKIRKRLKRPDEFDGFSDITRYEPILDLLLVGSVKTLVPTLQVGGLVLFDIWMYVITPENRMFPATLYWGQTGLSIGAWSKKGAQLLGKDPLEDFLELKEFSPHEFTEEEQNLFLDAFEFALKKVPVSDFWGIFRRDIGNHYVGVKKSKPFQRPLRHFKRDPGDSEAEKELEPLLGREFKDEYGESFSISRVPEMKIYVMEFEYEIKGENKYFGTAKDVLDFYKKILDKRKKEKIIDL